MANIAIILGDSGKGKSTAIKTLDPKTTVIINTLNKRLPFKGSQKIYNEANKNLFNIDESAKICLYLKGISDNEAMAHVKTIVIDDMIYSLRNEYFDKAQEKGYEKFAVMGAHFANIIKTAVRCRDDLNIYFVLHTEPIVSSGTIVGYKAALIGNLVEEKYNPIHTCTTILYADTRYEQGDQGKPTYGFYTKEMIVDGVKIPAKSPDGMFDEDFIPNDLDYVNKKMDEYYE